MCCRHNTHTHIHTHTHTHTHTLSLSLSQTMQFVLVDGDTPNAGRVEVYHSDEWGSICDDYFGFEEAAVICNELG